MWGWTSSGRKVSVFFYAHALKYVLSVHIYTYKTYINAFKKNKKTCIVFHLFSFFRRSGCLNPVDTFIFYDICYNANIKKKSIQTIYIPYHREWALFEIRFSELILNVKWADFHANTAYGIVSRCCSEISLNVKRDLFHGNIADIWRLFLFRCRFYWNSNQFYNHSFFPLYFVYLYFLLQSSFCGAREYFMFFTCNCTHYWYMDVAFSFFYYFF